MATNLEHLKPCPFCGDISLYVSDGDYYSGYEANGYRVSCRCHYAWNAVSWCKTEGEARRKWNHIIEQGYSLLKDDGENKYDKT